MNRYPVFRKSFLSHLNQDIGNPFSEISTDLYTLDTKVIMSECVVKTIKQQQNNTIRRNNLQLFNTSSSKTADRSTSRVTCLKTNVSLFSRMYISWQLRDSDMDEFLIHEDHAWPPSSASNSTVIHTTTGSDLISCVESIVPSETNFPNVDVKIIDVAGVVHRLEPRKAHTLAKITVKYLFLPLIY